MNPLRRSEEHLRSYIFQETPLGSSIENVLARINVQNWELRFINESKGFFHQGLNPNKSVGEKSIRASLGNYQNLFMTTNVTVFWGFNKKGELIDIWVWKTHEGT